MQKELWSKRRKSKMKKWTALLLAALMVVSVVACGSEGEIKPSTDDKKNENIENENAGNDEIDLTDATVGEILLSEFKKNADASAQEIADELLANSMIQFPPATMAVESGLLTGFDNAEITGFEEGVMFGPMISTIPFIGYIFVLEDGADVEAFKTTLEENANLRWNICAEAEELTVESEGNKVFFLMSPKNFEE